MQDYRVKCLNNLATAQLKLEQFDEALHTSRDVLTLEPNNVKALFRMGKVRVLPVVHLVSPLIFINPEMIITKRRIWSTWDFKIASILLLLYLCVFWFMRPQHCSHCTFSDQSAPVRQGRIQRGHGSAKKGLEAGASHQGEFMRGSVFLPHLPESLSPINTTEP